MEAPLLYFAGVRDKLAGHFAVPDTALSAFGHRLKHLQKMGWPKGSNAGRGRAAKYTPQMSRDLLLVMELCVLGIPPETAVGIVTSNLPSLRKALEHGEKVSVPCPPLFGERVPDGLITLDLKRASELFRETQPSGV